MQKGVLVVVSGMLVLSSCSGADHDALAARDASAGSGGTGGALIEAGISDADARPLTDVERQDGPLDSSFVPDGPSVFTFFNGIPNARSIRVCFEPESAAGFAPTDMAPLPNEPAGLAYGHAFAQAALVGIDLENTVVRPVVYGGDLAILEAMRCDQLDPLPEGILRASLPAIPANTLTRGRSVLMVAAGCLGGELPDLDAGNAQDVCGADFSPPASNATLFVASMDRKPLLGRFGVQVFAASVATESVTVDHLTVFPSKTSRLVSGLMPGQISPRPPADDLSVSDLGTNPEQNTLRVFGSGSGFSEPIVVTPLPEALARGGLSLDALEDGRNYTVVLVGPSVELGAGSWHKGFEVTVVPSEP